MNKTNEIFILAVNDEAIDGGLYGVSPKVLAGIVGNAGPYAENSNEYVAEVLKYAENFTTDIELAIKTVEGGDGDSKDSDLAAVKVMLDWTFDPVELEKLARKDWANRDDEISGRIYFTLTY